MILSLSTFQLSNSGAGDVGNQLGHAGRHSAVCSYSGADELEEPSSRLGDLYALRSAHDTIDFASGKMGD